MRERMELSAAATDRRDNAGVAPGSAGDPGAHAGGEALSGGVLRVVVPGFRASIGEADILETTHCQRFYSAHYAAAAYRCSEVRLAQINGKIL